MSTIENVARGLLITAFMAACTVAYAATYEVRIKCPQNPNVTESKYISANSDLEAQNEAMRILENNTAYRGKGCRIVSIEKR
jgi:hypothetical protein